MIIFAIDKHTYFRPISDSAIGNPDADSSSPGHSGIPDKPPRSFRRLGRFHLGEWIGGGGYGDVYVAYEPHLDREVALKILQSTKLDSKATRRFFREARAAAKLDHPSVVRVYDAGQDDGRYWIAYELVRGSPLSRIRDSGTLDHDGAVTIVRGLALALHHVHCRGILHRDLKPANIIVDEEGLPHLTDFGLARQLDFDSELTDEGVIIGTPAYIATEIAAGNVHQADARSDIYSLGIILYELLHGYRPGESVSHPSRRTPDSSTKHSAGTPIPAALSAICAKAMAPKPDDRYPDAAAFAQALDVWLGIAPPEPSKVKSAGLVLASMAVALIVASVIWLARPLPPNPVKAVAPVIEAPAIVVNLKSGMIHVSGCSTLHSVANANRKTFATLADAVKAEYRTLCKFCRKKPARFRRRI